MMVTLRQARLVDAQEIARVQIDTWRYAYRGIVPDHFLDALDAEERAAKWQSVFQDGSHTWVAEDGAEICGFINGGELRDGVHVAAQNFDAEIHTLYVTATHQGRGIGRQLMRALAVLLAADGWKRPVVWALEENPWCPFYERLGGRRVAQKMIVIGGKPLSDIAFGWDDIRTLC